PDLNPEAVPVAERVAAERHASLVVAPADVADDLPLAARGRFQRHNFALAATAARAFLGHELEPNAVADAARATRIPGRMDVVSDPRRAVARARELAGPTGAVLATGSIYLIADLVREPGRARASMI